MTAWPESRRAGLVAAVAARAEAWLLDPPPARSRAAEPEPRRPPVVAVVALAPRCGTTTIARALGVELARREWGAAIVSAAGPPRGPLVAMAPSRRLARDLGGEGIRAAGRLCLVEDSPALLRELATGRPGPLVLDLRHGEPPEGALAIADRSVLVAGPELLPALADVVGASLARADTPAPVVVVNRVLDPGPWADRPALFVGECKVAARMALAGRDPAGPLGTAVAELADLCLGEAG